MLDMTRKASPSAAGSEVMRQPPTHHIMLTVVLHGSLPHCVPRQHPSCVCFAVRDTYAVTL